MLLLRSHVIPAVGLLLLGAECRHVDVIPLKPTPPLDEKQLALLALDEFELPPSEWHTLPPAARAVAVAQYMLDFDLQRRCVPLIEFDSERFYVEGEPVTITLGAVIAKKAKSTIHEVVWHNGDSVGGGSGAKFPPAVIKYELSGGSGSVHALVHEWGFYEQLEGLGLTPRALVLSAPVSIESSLRTPKTEFKLDIGGNVRYLVMERIWGDMVEYMRKQASHLPLREALNVSIQTIRVLQQVHARDVLHGDLHLGNIVVFEVEPKLRVGVLDFGLSMFASDAALLSDRFSEFISVSDWKHSVWRMEGFRMAARDDVFMVLVNLGYMLDPKFLAVLVGEGKRGADIYEYWRSGDMWCVPTACSWLSQLPAEIQEEVKVGLGRFQSKIRALELTGDIPYDELALELQGVLDLLGAREE